MLGLTVCLKRLLRDLSAPLGILAVLAQPGHAGAQGKEKFVFALPNTPNVANGPLIFAEELGYFDTENLELQKPFPVLASSALILPQLMNGGIDSVFMTLEPLILTKQPDAANFDYKYVYNYARGSVYELVVLDESPIRTVADIAGKKVGVGALAWGNVAGTKGILVSQGVSLDSVSLAAVGDSAAALEALKSGQIDVLNLYDTKIVQFEQTGVKLRRIPLPDFYAKSSSNAIPFTSKFIQERPGTIARFGRALSKGFVACEAAVDNCVRAFWKRYPDLAPAVAKEGAAMESAKQILRAKFKSWLVFPEGKPREYGSLSDSDFTGLMNALKVSGQATKTDIPLDTLYTNQFVPEFNAFDREKVVAEAKAYKPR